MDFLRHVDPNGHGDAGHRVRTLPKMDFLSDGLVGQYRLPGVAIVLDSGQSHFKSPLPPPHSTRIV